MKYVFIIPLTPDSHMNPVRKKLQKLCFNAIMESGFKEMIAIVIGHSDNLPSNSQFTNIPFEGLKREKLKVALDYLSKNELNYDYLIRLDDDDLFNPSLLQEIESKHFDVFVDKTHHFYNPFEQEVARKTQYWFPNTYLIKKELALQKIESDIPGTINGLTLIEQDHNLHHHFLQDANIQFSKPHSPVYLRSITKESITANNASDINDYLNSFGNWNPLLMDDFDWLEPIEGEMKIVQSSIDRISNRVNEFRYTRNYDKMVLGR